MSGTLFLGRMAYSYLRPRIYYLPILPQLILYKLLMINFWIIGQLWAIFRGSPRSPIPARLVTILSEPASIGHHRESPHLQHGEFRSRLCSGLGISTAESTCSAFPTCSIFPISSEEIERNLRRSVVLFKEELHRYASQLEGAEKSFSTEMEIWARGERPSAVLILPAQELLARFYEDFFPLLNECRLDWEEAKQRYFKLERVIGRIPDFEVFKRALQTFDNWSTHLRYLEEIGHFHVAALHETLQNLPDKEEEISLGTRQRWEALCRQLSQKRWTPYFFHRLMVMSIANSGQVPLSQAGFALAHLTDWLDRSFQLPFLDQNDPNWQEDLKEGRVIPALFARVLVGEVGGCRIYEVGEADEQLIVSWKNESALSRLIGASKLNFPIHSIEPNGLSGKVPRTFALLSSQGRRVVKDSSLIGAVQRMVLEKKMPFDLSQSMRVNRNGEVVWMVDSTFKAPFNPFEVEAFLVMVSSEKSHRWMNESGAGRCDEAKLYRSKTVLSFHQDKLTPRMESELEGHVNRLIATFNEPRPGYQTVLDWLRERVKTRWLSDQGLIKRFTDAFLSQFDQEARDRFSASRSPSTSSPARRKINYFD